MADQMVVVEFETPASPGVLNITSPDITEDAKVVILVWGTSLSDNTDENHGRAGISIHALEDLNADETGGALSPRLRQGSTTPDSDYAGGNTSAVVLVDETTTALDISSTITDVIPGGVELTFATTATQVKGKAIILAGNSMRSWGGSLARTSTTPTQENTGPTGPDDHFQPDLLIAIPCTENTDTPIVAASAMLGIGGAVAGTIQKCGVVDWDNTAEPADADGVLRSGRISASLSGLRAELGMVVAINSTGFTYAGATATTTRMRYVAVKFGGPFNVGVANFPVSGATGEQSFSFGFNPRVVFGASFLLTSEDSLTDGETASGAGWFITGPLGSRAASIRHEEGVSSSSHSATSRQGDHAVLTLNELGAVAQQASFVSSSGGNLVLNFSTATAGYLTAIGIQLGAASPAEQRQRAAQRRSQPARSRASWIGGVVPRGALARILKVWDRQRRAMFDRLHQRRKAPVRTPEIGAVLEEHSIGVVARSGLLRGVVVGPGVRRQDDE